MRPVPRKSQTACTYCRGHKIRCSRMLPRCTRCSRYNLECNYPAPPDRRQIANRRRSPSPLRRNPDPVLLDQENDSAEVPRISHQIPSIHNGYHTPPGHEPTSQGDGEDINVSPGLAECLINTYFNHIFNANLLFHRSSFMEDFRNGLIKSYVYQSIFAVASLLLATENPELPSRKWAEVASLNTLQHADKADLDVIQTCENLALYWWAVKEPRRAFIHSKMSQAVSGILIHDLEFSKPVSSQPLIQEITRRCIWSCWIKHCVCDRAYPDPTGVFPVPRIPLPCVDDIFDQTTNFQDCISEAETITQSVTSRDALSRPSNALVRVFSLWHEVKMTVYSQVLKVNEAYIGRIFELDGRIRQMRVLLENMPPNPSIPTLASSRNKHVLISCAYHQCLLLLHACNCPALADDLQARKVPPLVTESATRTVSESATSILTLLSSVLEGDSAVLIRSPFIGYCAFTAGVVQLILYRMTFYKGFVVYVTVAMRVLEKLATCWPALKDKEEKLRDLFTLFISTTTSETGGFQAQGINFQEMHQLGAEALDKPETTILIPSVVWSMPIGEGYPESLQNFFKGRETAQDNAHHDDSSGLQTTEIQPSVCLPGVVDYHSNTRQAHASDQAHEVNPMCNDAIPELNVFDFLFPDTSDICDGPIV